MAKVGRVKKRLIFLIAILFLYFATLEVLILGHANDMPEDGADYLIILGARVKGEVPSLALKARIDAAASYLLRNPSTIAIASGGQGKGEDISEAMAIKEGLINEGIDEKRIIMEDKSTTTYENISFSKKLIPKGLEKGLVVTNSFHIYRAKNIARDAGLALEGLAAETPRQAIVKSYSREYLAITKYYLTTAF